MFWEFKVQTTVTNKIVCFEIITVDVVCTATANVRLTHSSSVLHVCCSVCFSPPNRHLRHFGIMSVSAVKTWNMSQWINKNQDWSYLSWKGDRNLGRCSVLVWQYQGFVPKFLESMCDDFFVISSTELYILLYALVHSPLRIVWFVVNWIRGSDENKQQTCIWRDDDVPSSVTGFELKFLTSEMCFPQAGMCRLWQGCVYIYIYDVFHTLVCRFCISLK